MLLGHVWTISGSPLHKVLGACQDEDEDGEMASQRARDLVPKVCRSPLQPCPSTAKT